MDSRFKKFLDDEFNVAELETLRNDVAAMSDEELSSKLDEQSERDDFTEEDIDELRRRLNDEIKQNRRNRMLHYIATAAAAVLVLAISVSGVFVFKMQQKNHLYEDLLSHEVSIGTQQGENISTYLPDGSKIVMSPESSLAYKLSSFNHLERRVHFSGEAKFSVVRNENAPFLVHSRDFEIKVLGTVFSVLSRDDKDYVEVHLNEGAIELTAVKSNTREILKTGETAVIDRRSGDMTVYGEEDNYRYSAGRPVLFFSSEPLDDVLAELALYYGKDFAVAENVGAKTFTGSLPTDNLEQALYILQQTLRLKISIDEETYCIR